MAVNTGKVIEKDLGWERIKKDILSLKGGVEIKIGLFGNGNSPKNNLAYRGTVHEFGIPEGIKITEKMRNFLHAIGIHVRATTNRIYIPSRPFTRTGFDKNLSKLKRAIEKWFGDLIDGKISLKKFLNKIGVLHTNQIQSSIRDGNWKRNHPVTEKRKGSTRPLIDNSEMINGIKHKIIWRAG